MVNTLTMSHYTLRFLPRLACMDALYPLLTLWLGLSVCLTTEDTPMECIRHFFEVAKDRALANPASLGYRSGPVRAV